MQELYINGIKADLSSSTTIPITLQSIDTETPTAEHNAYSKSVVLEGTPTNNEIFGDYWKLDRNNINIYDARKRVGFRLYDNGNVVLNGYVKLDKVNVKDNKVSYSVTLYSSLGDFFYNLSYDTDGKERTLASLRYWLNDSDGNVMSLDDENEKPLFNWNASFITSGWSMGMDWQYGQRGTYPIEVFKGAPTYRGYYDDFSNDTVMVKYSELNTTDQGYIDDAFVNVEATQNRYGAYNNWVTLKASRDLDEWEVRDLRSKYMRPSVPLRMVLDAIGDKENNGGYEVTYDSDVMSSPLFQKGWLIMDSIDFEDEASYNSLVNLYVNTAETTSHSGSTDLMNIDDARKFSIADMETPTVEFNIKGDVFLTRDRGDNLYTSINHTNAGGRGGYACGPIYNGWHIRLDIYQWVNTTPTLIKSSPDYFVHTDSLSTAYPYNDNILNHIASKIGVQSLTDRTVSLVKGGDYAYHYIWDNPLTMKMSIPITTNQVSFQLVFEYVQYCPKVEQGYVPASALNAKYVFDSQSQGFNLNGHLSRYEPDEEDSIYVSGYYDGTVNPNVQPMTVTKPMIFHTGITPLDVLLGFTKLIGARYLVDDVDKKVTILPRSKYFIEGVNDIVIDESDKEVTPVLCDKKWYEYGLENVDTYAAKLYRKKNALEYGHLNVDTGFEFNNDTENVFETVKLTNLIPYKLNSIYFNDLASSSTTIMMSPTVEVGCFYLSGTTLLENHQNVYARAHYSKPYKVWDKIPKLCGFGDDNDSEDIGMTLAVIDGYASDKISVSDNCEMMYYLNGDNPCFIWTNSGSGDTDNTGSEKQANYIVESWPLFSKYITGSNGTYSFSLDFMKPRQTFIGDAAMYGDGICMYDLYHKEYINSIYHRNGEKVTLKANILEKPQMAVRKVYRFNNSLWLLTEITDWVANQDFTKCTFARLLSEENLHRWGG